MKRRRLGVRVGVLVLCFGLSSSSAAVEKTAQLGPLEVVVRLTPDEPVICFCKRL